MSAGINKMPVNVPINIMYNYFSRVRQESSSNICWEWSGPKNKNGYGYFSALGKKIKAHRFSYYLQNNIDPVGFVVLHKCDNPSCCNPYHLEIGTDKMNADDRVRKGRGNIGEKNGASKYCKKKVLDIRGMYDTGVEPKEIANKFGVKYDYVMSVGKRRIWKHV